MFLPVALTLICIVLGFYVTASVIGLTIGWDTQYKKKRCVIHYDYEICVGSWFVMWVTFNSALTCAHQVQTEK